MDPNLFHIDYERLFEVLITIVVFSFFIERALSVIFESRLFIDITEKRPKTKKIGLKELISLLISIFVCSHWKLDAFTIILASGETTTAVGTFITGVVVAGGSKASIKLFKDVLGFMSSAEKDRLESKKRNKSNGNLPI